VEFLLKMVRTTDAELVNVKGEEIESLRQFCLIGVFYLIRIEIVAPFHTTSVRSYNYESPGSGPIYYPFKRDLRQHVTNNIIL